MAITIVREHNTQKVLEFPVTVAGTWKGIASNMLAPNACFDSLNVFLREGKLRTRPGYQQHMPTFFDNAVVGGAMAVTPTEKVLIAITPTTLYTLRDTDNEWQIDTTISFALNNNSVIDVAFMETGNDYYMFIANNESLLKQWTEAGGGSVIVPVTGTTPQAKSVCIAGRRVVALVSPHTIRWTAVFDHTDWNVLNVNKVAQTSDDGICVKALSTLSFAVYKERSIYLAKAVAGSDARAFSFSEPIEVEGPAGVRAVVNVDGAHIYMTATGRIGYFDGRSMVQWLADGLWFFLQQDIDPVYTYKIFGVYDYRLHTVTFYYARNGDSGLMKGMVVMNIPLEGSGVVDYAPFLGSSAIPISHGYERRFDAQVNRSELFSADVDKHSFEWNEEYKLDGIASFDCMIQTPMLPLPDLKTYQLNVEGFFERGIGYGSVTAYAVTSQSLESKEGVVDSTNGQTLGLEFAPTGEHFGFNTPCKFFGLRYNWRSTDTVKYAGSIVYGRVV